MNKEQIKKEIRKHEESYDYRYEDGYFITINLDTLADVVTELIECNHKELVEKDKRINEILNTPQLFADKFDAIVELEKMFHEPNTNPFE